MSWLSPPHHHFSFDIFSPFFSVILNTLRDTQTARALTQTSSRAKVHNQVRVPVVLCRWVVHLCSVGCGVLVAAQSGAYPQPQLDVAARHSGVAVSEAFVSYHVHVWGLPPAVVRPFSSRATGIKGTGEARRAAGDCSSAFPTARLRPALRFDLLPRRVCISARRCAAALSYRGSSSPW